MSYIMRQRSYYLLTKTFCGITLIASLNNTIYEMYFWHKTKLRKKYVFYRNFIILIWGLQDWFDILESAYKEWLTRWFSVYHDRICWIGNKLYAMH